MIREITLCNVMQCAACAQAPLWESDPNMALSNGIATPSATTKAQCQAACIANSACVAIDVDSRVGNTLCWIHNSANDLTTARSETGVELLILKDRCPTGVNLFCVWQFSL